MGKFNFIVEPEAFEGVKRIAKKIALDFEKVGGEFPVIADSFKAGESSVVFATLGKSPFADKQINEGKFDTCEILGKREVYKIKFIDSKTLLVCGSDKRGTIYGMFALSEYIGVSPLHFWGDVEPVYRGKIELTAEIEMVSKEPSVKYRGFFINDEWPCFGSWTHEKFGGFTAEMYDHVFELLLRLKGNYLWPAMWSSSFALDGPGNLNEELADIYGVVVGASHHEHCLRSSEEWGKVKGPESEYGNEWNYYVNKKGLLKYWEDGLKRSGKYEKIITIGMRGERDSSMLGSDSSLKDNIDLLKDIIKNQRELIKKIVNPDIDNVVQLLALYKEVEEYFYGNDKIEGLKDWNELNNVICMLCEDNFGFLRTLPTKEMQASGRKFGMYYHFDYHGAPVSYEWMPSASFERTWEQMCMAYDYGVKDIWIVNAGDLKFNEVPLNYFMELAYDFEKWGTLSVNNIENYTAMWLEKNFPAADVSIRKKMSDVLHGYIRMNAKRRPESLNSDIYHPCHYLEADRMLSFAKNLEIMNEEIFSALCKDCKDAYYSMIYYPAKASTNLLKMHLYAGKNRHYAKQGKKIANKYADLVTECIEKDRLLSEEFSKFKNDKWKGMEKAQHIGFTRWNEDNCRYPLRYRVEPAYKPRLVVSRKDREEIFTKNYGNPMTIEVNDFLYAGTKNVILEIANDGINSLNYTIEADGQYDWLEISSLKGSVEFQEEITLSINNKLTCGETRSARLLIKDGETVVAVDIKARAVNTENLPALTFLENNGLIVMEANHYCSKNDTKGLGDMPSCGFVELKNCGRNGSGMKVFPTTVDFSDSNSCKNEERPSVSYRFLLEESGEYTIEVWTVPTNSVQKNRPLRFLLESQVVTTVPADFQAGNPYDARWSMGVLSNIRINSISMTLEKGVREISISALEAGLVIERILVYKKDANFFSSYLGPPESFFTGG
jgi:hypothetical protein